MNAFVKTFAFTLIAGLTVATFTTSSTAAEPKALMLNPGNGGFVPQPHLPKFGFSSVNIGGIGERVTNVRWGGLASQLGLEPGDLILSMNGFKLSYYGSWNDALHNAVYHNGGWVRLRIRDVRTGHVVQRQLFAGDDVAHYHGDGHPHFGVPSGPPTLKSSTGPKNENPAPKLKKQIVKLLN